MTSKEQVAIKVTEQEGGSLYTAKAYTIETVGSVMVSEAAIDNGYKDEIMHQAQAQAKATFAAQVAKDIVAELKVKHAEAITKAVKAWVVENEEALVADLVEAAKKQAKDQITSYLKEDY